MKKLIDIPEWLDPIEIRKKVNKLQTEARNILHGGKGEFQLLNPRKRTSIIRYVV